MKPPVPDDVGLTWGEIKLLMARAKKQGTKASRFVAAYTFVPESIAADWVKQVRKSEVPA